MTYNEVYRHLMQVRLIDKRIWLTTVEHAELQSCLLPAAITYDKDIVQTSPEDKMADIAGKVVELEHKIRRLNSTKARLIVQIRNEIGQIEDEDQRVVLSAFFLAKQSMRDIADGTCRSISGVYTIRRKGILALRTILENKMCKLCNL